MSEHAARLVFAEVGKRSGVETELVDVAALPITVDDAGAGAKDPQFAETMNRADAIVIVAPEYNHGYPGSSNMSSTRTSRSTSTRRRASSECPRASSAVRG